ncbi:MAG: RluA family pseudouridine synthase, partial [Proteobacteria bacterium]|nr:RluA family pseudouridine synthase [Pseudomonadota bacterium]
LDITYEDATLIVINKPAGLVVHPAPGNPDRTLVNALIHHCGDSLRGIGGVRRPGIVHRLDKDTSGLIVAAKTNAAHQSLVQQFAAHSIERAYLAVVWGVPAPHRGTIHTRIGRSRHNRKKMATLTHGGREAITHYQVRRVLAEGRIALVQCTLETGRTHQIRVHLASIGYPVLGDQTYGRRRGQRLRDLPESPAAAAAAFGRQALHAFRLGFKHPESQELKVFEANLPDDMTQLIDQLDDQQIP